MSTLSRIIDFSWDCMWAISFTTHLPFAIVTAYLQTQPRNAKQQGEQIWANVQKTMAGRGVDAETLFNNLDTDKSGGLKMEEFGNLIASARLAGMQSDSCTKACSLCNRKMICRC